MLIRSSRVGIEGYGLAEVLLCMGFKKVIFLSENAFLVKNIEFAPLLMWWTYLKIVFLCIFSEKQICMYPG